MSTPEEIAEALSERLQAPKGRAPVDSYPFSLKTRTPGQVEAETKRRGKSIWDNYEYLGKILEKHEEIIQKRWLRKSRKQRLKVLLTAWPDMMATRRPFHDFLHTKGMIGEFQDPRVCETVKIASHDAFLFPYINQEALGKPKPLLLLLNSRGRHPPPSFIDADLQSLLAAVFNETVATGEYPSDSFLVFMKGITSGDDYGNLRSMDDIEPQVWGSTRTEEAEPTFHYIQGPKSFYQQLYPHEAMVILEVQERLMNFLVMCCHEILHEFEPNDLLSDAYPNQPEPALPDVAKTEARYTSLLEITFESPYRTPTRLDFANLETLFAAKASAAEDHVWALREDPNYFVERLSEMYGHIHDKSKKGFVNEKRTWGKVFGQVLADAYIMVEMFSGLHQQAKTLRNLQQKYAAVISTDKKLPKEYLTGIRHFVPYILTSQGVLLEKLDFFTRKSGYLKDVCYRKRSKNFRDLRDQSKNEEFLLMWVFRLIFAKEEMNSCNVIPNGDRRNLAMNELELGTERDETINEFFSQTAQDRMGDFAIIVQALNALEHFEPWSISFGSTKDEEDGEDGEGRSAEAIVRPKIHAWEQIIEHIRETSMPDLIPLGEPVAGRFTYPVHRRRNKENVEMMRRAEANLDAFWERADRYLYERTEKMDESAVIQLLKEPRALQRTPEWVEPTKSKPVKTPDLEQPLSSFFFGLSSSMGCSEMTIRPPTAPIKAKVKTRGTAGTPTENDEVIEAMAETTLEDTKSIFRVDQRALKALRTMFHNPDITSTPGEVAWNDFLHALASIGFTAEKLYGSVWQFSPTYLDAHASIHFHEPHPKGKLPFVHARRCGRRLNRKYGWTGEQFVLDK